ncbi:MAG: tRNA 2-thiouridine(34) synthase MnmA [Patescibacteria group bacterium]
MIIKKNIKVAIAMSGGVDSSVAAALLVKQGYDCFGIFMHFWSEPSQKFQRANRCCSLDSLTDARRVCHQLGIKLYVLNFDQLFKQKIVNDFLKQYASGKTPNPCVRCNQYIKFGELLKKIKGMGADYLATGHYIKKTKKQESKKAIYLLSAAKDQNKDQSYFLYNLKQQQLKNLLFPVGDYTKSEVRKLATKFKLPTAQRRESQEICFIQEKNHNNFLKRHLKIMPGKIITTTGQTIGNHLGLPLYTIGQRKGVGLGGGPYYVAGFDLKNNQLIVAANSRDKRLFYSQLLAKQVNWVAGKNPRLPLNCLAKVRYRQKELPVTVRAHGKNYLVKFKKTQRAVTPGQSVVFYLKKELLGGGIII